MMSCINIEKNTGISARKIHQMLKICYHDNSFSDNIKLFFIQKKSNKYIVMIYVFLKLADFFCIAKSYSQRKYI